MKTYKSSGTALAHSTIASTAGRHWASASAARAVADLTLAEAAQVASGRLEGSDATIAGYSIDSRTVQQGDLFFALVGQNHDGHAFVQDALAAGARAAVVSAPMEAPDDKALVRVADTLQAMQEMAAHVRRREAVQVVGITGSAGKTTTKEMTYRLLAGKFQAYRAEGNLNNLFGMPLAMLRMPAGTQVAVLEMGMSTPGELRRLSAIATPDVSVLTNVGMAHRANFDSVEDIAAAKEELFLEMGGRGTGVFNADDDHCRGIAERFAGFRFTFGMQHDADLSASKVKVEGPASTSLTVHHGPSSWPVRISLAGVHHAYNLLAALSAGFMLGCDLEWMTERARVLAPLAGRGATLQLGGGIEVVDDTYNSNPAALERAIATLGASAASGSRRVLITGDMLELGDEAVRAHRDAGRQAAEAGIDVVLAVGPLSAETAEGAREAGVKTVLHCADSEAAGAAAASLVEPGDTVLVKGSRGMQMERVVQQLQAAAGAAPEEQQIER
jgi:UDP-N-acetylmuramoyl-tripeptide--D-alanyl-D-alanine ligase